MSIQDPIKNIVDSIHLTERVYGAPPEARELARRRGPDIAHEPTDADWADYRAAVDAARKIADNEFIYSDIEVEEPRTYSTPGEYVETEADWIARCKTAIADHGIPRNLDRVLSVSEFRKLGLSTEGHWRGWDRQTHYPTGGITYGYINAANADQGDQA